MNIIEFCNLHQIKWFPILVQLGEPKGGGGREKHCSTPYLDLVSFESSDTDIKERQDLLQNPKHLFNAIAIDTEIINQIDVDTPDYSPEIQHLLETAPYYKSVSRPFGRHIFCSLAGKPAGLQYYHKWKGPNFELICGSMTFCYLEGVVENSNLQIPKVEF